MSPTPSQVLLPFISLLSLFFCILPLPWHWRARNVGTLVLVAWLVTSNIIHLVNTILWPNDHVSIIAPIYCDITTKIIFGATTGVTAAALCITRNLAEIASTRSLGITKSERKRQVIGDLLLGLGLPALVMILHIIVQGHRFDIFGGGLGCNAALYASWPTVVLLCLPILLACIACVYAGIAIRFFVNHRAQFGTLLQSSKACLTASRYFRLMGLAGCLVLANLGTQLYNLAIILAVTGLNPYKSWDYVHADFGFVGQIPRSFMPDNVYSGFLVQWSFVPVASTLFFLFFGIGHEAHKEYRSWGLSAKRLLRLDKVLARVSTRKSNNIIIQRETITDFGDVRVVVAPLHSWDALGSSASQVSTLSEKWESPTEWEKNPDKNGYEMA